MKKRFVGAIVALVLLTGLVGVWIEPYYTLRMIQSAARSGDTAALAEYVDFPSVRESVRSQLTAQVRAKVPGSGLMANMGRGIMTGIVTQMVDAFVTPETIVRLVRGESPAPVGATAPASDSPSAPAATDRAAAEGERGHSRAYYITPNRFEVEWYVGDKPSGAPKLILMRTGLRWKLVALDLAFAPPTP